MSWLLCMKEILHQSGTIWYLWITVNDGSEWERPSTNWCRISSIHSMTSQTWLVYLDLSGWMWCLDISCNQFRYRIMNCGCLTIVSSDILYNHWYIRYGTIRWRWRVVAAKLLKLMLIQCANQSRTGRTYLIQWQHVAMSLYIMMSVRFFSMPLDGLNSGCWWLWHDSGWDTCLPRSNLLVTMTHDREWYTDIIFHNLGYSHPPDLMATSGLDLQQHSWRSLLHLKPTIITVETTVEIVKTIEKHIENHRKNQYETEQTYKTSRICNDAG